MERLETGWILTDGHAGNVRQARALATALGIATREWTLDARAPWRWLAPRQLPGAHRAFGQAFAQAVRRPPPLVIGCGRQAALATRLARRHGAKAVQILDPRIHTGHWDLVVAPEHDALAGTNVITTTGSLHPVDDAWLAAGRDSFPQLGTLPRPRIALLLGGPTANAGYTPEVVLAWVEELAKSIERRGGSLLATASRRTPADVCTHLKSLIADRVHGIAWCAGDAEPNPYAGLLGWADAIVCTPDSVNMVSEAVATDRPVIVPGAGLTRGRLRRFLDSLAARGRIHEALPPTFDPQSPLRETARVAADVRARLQLPAAAPVSSGLGAGMGESAR